MTKPKHVKRTSMFCLVTSQGTLGHVTFAEYRDNRERALEAAHILRDRWIDGAEHLIPYDIEIVEQ